MRQYHKVCNTPTDGSSTLHAQSQGALTFTRHRPVCLLTCAPSPSRHDLASTLYSPDLTPPPPPEDEDPAQSSSGDTFAEIRRESQKVLGRRSRRTLGGAVVL
ncbi:hypothetical protein C0J45_8120 [Silurus meridionalis]|uniref:Uncharacterized protein n=1 Tax=Silurus meridionalis TaxID=175797 RepID=A0A8T0BCK5_SILME|nr:hypothetical protein HF521_021883 [Silurus meridionalis]KAI5102768.1 hypothetical protein C0J45_8120 [Silurus meridionalis]